MGDAGFDVKWRFYENGPLSFAFKPGIAFPTGSRADGLGTGEMSWSTYLVASYEIQPWAFLLHGGYQHHSNSFNERVDIWHASAALVFRAGEQWKLILDGGIDNNTDRTARSDPTFVILGAIWSPRPDADVDIGFKHASSDTEHRHTLLAGLTLRW